MTGELVARARAALDGVTDGPWETGETSAHTSAVWSVRDNALMIAGYTTDDDARFIARARSLVPELADEVERLTAALHQCQCWVGHGSCGGCSGYPGIAHEPACGFEWNQACPVHGVLAEELERLRGQVVRLAGEVHELQERT